MSGYDEAVIFEGAQRMALEEFSGAVERQCKDLAKEIVKVSGVKIPPKIQMEVAAMVDEVVKLMMDKAKHFASILKDGIDEIHREQASKAPVETGKAAAVIQTEKMDKAPVVKIQTEKVDKAPVDKIQSEKVDKAPVDKIQSEKVDKAPVDKIQSEKMDKAPVDKIQSEKVDKAPVDGENGWWDVSVGANGKYRLPDAFVRSILAMPTVPLHADIPYLQTPNLAQILGVTEESLKEDRRLFYGEDAVRSKRISDNFVQFQQRIREEWDRQGYVEVGEEYITNMIKKQNLSDELWEEEDCDFPYADPNDPYYASLYEHCRKGDPEGFCLVKCE